MNEKLVQDLAIHALVLAGSEFLEENRDLTGLGIGLEHLQNAALAITGKLIEDARLTLTLSVVRHVVRGLLNEDDSEHNEVVHEALFKFL